LTVRFPDVILANHVIISCYGFWLPNEERGSWSDFVRSWELFRRFGPATKVDTHRSVARRPYDRARKREMQESLKYPVVVFDGLQARAVARGFALQVEKCGYVVHACAILKDHSHLVIARHHYGVEQVVNLLKGAASRQLQAEGIHPLQEYARDDESLPSPWASKCWKVFLDDEEDVRRAVQYVEDNPVKEGKRPQSWSFVVPFES
jgi:REP element-mobilizing transposase RayT